MTLFVSAVMEELGFPHDPDKWRLFIDASKLSSKAIVLHNGEVKPY
jgi:hypothetical protein